MINLNFSLKIYITLIWFIINYPTIILFNLVIQHQFISILSLYFISLSFYNFLFIYFYRLIIFLDTIVLNVIFNFLIYILLIIFYYHSFIILNLLIIFFKLINLPSYHLGLYIILLY